MFETITSRSPWTLYLGAALVAAAAAFPPAVAWLALRDTAAAFGPLIAHTSPRSPQAPVASSAPAPLSGALVVQVDR